MSCQTSTKVDLTQNAFSVRKHSLYYTHIQLRGRTGTAFLYTAIVHISNYVEELALLSFTQLLYTHPITWKNWHCFPLHSYYTHIQLRGRTGTAFLYTAIIHTSNYVEELALLSFTQLLYTHPITWKNWHYFPLHSYYTHIQLRGRTGTAFLYTAIIHIQLRGRTGTAFLYAAIIHTSKDVEELALLSFTQLLYTHPITWKNWHCFPLRSYYTHIQVCGRTGTAFLYAAIIHTSNYVEELALLSFTQLLYTHPITWKNWHCFPLHSYCTHIQLRGRTGTAFLYTAIIHTSNYVEELALLSFLNKLEPARTFCWDNVFAKLSC